MVRERGRSHIAGIVSAALWITLAVCPAVLAQAGSSGMIDNPLLVPDARRILPTATDAGGISSTLQILVLMTVLTLVPSILILTTSFARVMIVMGLLRQALATPQLPPGQVLLGLSLFITMLVMAPTWQKIHAEALTPYLNNELSQREAMDRALKPLREFMYRQIESGNNQEDIYLFLEYQRGRPVQPSETVTLSQVDSTVLIPAFVLSELKISFVIGFRMYLPFLVIDMVIAAILISMGMMMLPPVLISLPFKILLFVLADGWHLVARTLMASFS